MRQQVKRIQWGSPNLLHLILLWREWERATIWVSKRGRSIGTYGREEGRGSSLEFPPLAARDAADDGGSDHSPAELSLI